MSALTGRQQAVRSALRASREMPQTVSEIADALNAPTTGVRAALTSLEKRGLAERAGVALTGAQTWRATR